VRQNHHDLRGDDRMAIYQIRLNLLRDQSSCFACDPMTLRLFDTYQMLQGNFPARRTSLVSGLTFGRVLKLVCIGLLGNGSYQHVRLLWALHPGCDAVYVMTPVSI
jgi:hypothetical protein